MIIHERLNFNESVQFILSMRKTVATVVAGAKNLSEVQRVELRSFLLNEASDYEIMHLAIKGELPKEKFNINAEMRLFSDLKESLLINYETLSTILDPETIALVMTEVGPVSPITSTALPVLEYYLQEETMSDDEGDPEKVRKAVDAVKNFVKDAGTSFDKKTGEAADSVNKAVDRAKEAWGDPAFRKQVMDDIKEKGLSAAQAMKNFKDKLQGFHSKNQDYGSRHPEAKPDTDLKSDAQHYAGKVVEKGKEAVSAVKKLAKDHDVEGKVARGAEAVADKGRKIYNQAKEVAGKPAGEVIAKGAEKAQQAYERGKELAGTAGGTALAATALAGVAAYGASKIYKRFFSQAARACSGKSGAQKTACMQQYKMKANQAKVQSLMRSKATCKKAKNPQKCMAAIDAEIQKAKAKAGK